MRLHSWTRLADSRRRTPQQERSRDKVVRIMRAAAELLQELPYSQVSTRLMAEQAGVSVATLYRIFPDKQSVINSLVLQWLDDFVALLDDLAVGDLPLLPGDFLDQVFDAYAEFFRQTPGFRQIWFHGPVDPQLAGTQHDNDRDLADRLHNVLRNHYHRDDPGLATAVLLAVQVGSYLMNLAFRDDPHGDPKTLTEAKKLIRRYLQV